MHLTPIFPLLGYCQRLLEPPLPSSPLLLVFTPRSRANRMSFSLISAPIELHLELILSILRYFKFLIFDHHRHLSRCIVLEPPSIHQTQT